MHQAARSVFQQERARAPAPGPVRLAPAHDRAFRWLLDLTTTVPHPGVSLADGGIESEAVLRMLRDTARRCRDLRTPAAWLIVADHEVVGLISYKNPPRSGRAIEIGYGICPSRRNRGYASAAVAGLLAISRRDPRIEMLTAQTVFGNGPSERVLAGNGFVPCETRIDEEDGPIRVWRRALR